MKQTTFASAAWEKQGKMRRRERFSGEMDQIIPWAQILALIGPHYPKAGNGTQPMPMQRMLRIYFMQQWFNLSDPAVEDTPYDSESMRRFAGLELLEDAVPDESTILRFRHLLEQQRLSEQIFALVRGLLKSKRLLLKSGTIVDATIIDAPRSANNRRPNHSHRLTRAERAINRICSGTRARAEHTFHVIKKLWAYQGPLPGLAKNTARLYAMFALANLYLLRRRLMPAQGTCRC